MNELARKKARRAELEAYLLGEYSVYREAAESFAAWLEQRASTDASWYYKAAKELIALYESEPIGEREEM